MKRIVLIVLFAGWVCGEMLSAQNNVITYLAKTKIPEITEKSPNIGLHPKAFNAKIVSHEFADGVGTITFDGNVTNIGQEAFRSCSQMTRITIPATVTSFGVWAFYSCMELDSIVIPAAVTRIGNQALAYCNKMTAIMVEEGNKYFVAEDGVLFDIKKTKLIQYPRAHVRTEYAIPSTVTDVGDYAFYFASKLEKVSFPTGLKTIGKYAFYYLPKMDSLVFSEGLKTIGANAFQSCSSLRYIHFPNTLTTLGAKAFYYAVKVDTITIPASVTSIGAAAFSRCDKLVCLRVDSANKKYRSEDNVLFTYNKEKLLLYLSTSNRTTYTVPETVMTIMDEAFANCKMMDSIFLPSQLTTIGNNSFSYCSKLVYITMPNTVTKIGTYAFQSCSKLDSIHIPAKLTTISDYAFSSCMSLHHVTLPASLTSIGKAAFNNCPKLSRLSIPDKVTTIGQDAFSGCRNLDSIVLPTSIKTIGASAFKYCTGVLSITIPDSLSDIGKNAFLLVNNIVYHGEITEDYPWGAKSVNGYVEAPLVYEDASKVKVVGCAGTARGEMVIPESVEVISKNAFTYCGHLTSFVVGNHVDSIGNCAVSYCDSIRSVKFGNSVQYIGESAFEGCYELDSVVLPNSLRQVGWGAFMSCEGLTHVEWPATVSNIDDGVFAYCSELKSVILPEGVTRLGVEAFSTSYALDTIILPSSLEVIDEAAFDFCDALRLVRMGDKVTYIGAYAFEGCYQMRSIHLSASLESIGTAALAECMLLDSLVCRAPIPPVCDESAFVWIPDSVVVQVPFGSEYLYRKAPGWNRFGPFPTYSLAESGANDSILAAWKGATIDVTISRPWYRDGEYNTLCLPFSLSAEQIAQSALADYLSIQTIDSVQIVNPGEESETLVFVLKDTDAIAAGYPYLIRWKETAGLPKVIHNLSFTEMTIEVSEPIAVELSNGVTFRGTFSPYRVEACDKGVMFVGSGGKLNWPNADGYIRGFRALFEIDFQAQSAIHRGMSACLSEERGVRAGDSESVGSVEGENQRRICKLLECGRVVVLHHGVRYDMLGRKIE